jgi:hypothetical protein
MIVDNSVKFFLSSSRVIGPVLGFVAKNILITIINKMQEKTDVKNDLQKYDYQYYSVSIRF